MTVSRRALVFVAEIGARYGDLTKCLDRESVGGEACRLPLSSLGRSPEGHEEEIEASGDRVHFDPLGCSAGLERFGLGTAELLEEASGVVGFAVGEMAADSRGRWAVRAREPATVVAVERYGDRAVSLARALREGPGKVSRQLHRAAVTWREDSTLAGTFAGLDAERPGSDPARSAR